MSTRDYPRSEKLKEKNRIKERIFNKLVEIFKKEISTGYIMIPTIVKDEPYKPKESENGFSNRFSVKFTFKNSRQLFYLEIELRKDYLFEIFVSSRPLFFYHWLEEDKIVFPVNESIVLNNLEKAFKYWLTILNNRPFREREEKFKQYMYALSHSRMYSDSIISEGANPKSLLSKMSPDLLSKINRSLYEPFH